MKSHLVLGCILLLLAMSVTVAAQDEDGPDEDQVIIDGAEVTDEDGEEPTETILEAVPAATATATVTATPTTTRPPTPVITIIIITPNVTPTRAPAGSVLLQDNFEDPGVGWIFAVPRTGWSGNYEGGEFRIQKLSGTRDTYTAPILGSFQDASVAVDVRFASTNTGQSVALTCRESSTSGYGFVVLPAARSGVLIRLDSETSAAVLAGPQTSAQIRTGGQPNRVELSCAGNTISASVNGAQIFSVQDSRHAAAGGMSISISGANGVDTRLDNLVVTQR